MGETGGIIKFIADKKYDEVLTVHEHPTIGEAALLAKGFRF